MFLQLLLKRLDHTTIMDDHGENSAAKSHIRRIDIMFDVATAGRKYCVTQERDDLQSLVLGFEHQPDKV